LLELSNYSNSNFNIYLGIFLILSLLKSFRKLSLGFWNTTSKVLGLIFNNNKILIGITLFKLSKFYLVFENFVQIFIVGFKFEVQILPKQVFKFISKLFHTSMQYYSINR
jgi:hypothetical protein